MTATQLQNHFPQKKLADLLPGYDLGAAASITPNNLCLDSRQVGQGDAFVALVGTQTDGRQFISRAVEAGAAAILVEADKVWQGINWIGSVPVIAVDALLQHMSALAGRFYDEPSQELRLLGITGTNGKTTCSLLLGQLLARLLGTSAVVGTLGYGIVDAKSLTPIEQQIGLLHSTGLTTPDPISLQRILRELRNIGAQSAAIEVSSHSLQQKRVAGLHFDTAIFTNLTQDHLDYHGDLISYGKAKAELLFMPGLKHAIFNWDDLWSRALVDKTPSGVTRIAYSLREVADVYLQNIQLNSKGASAHLVTPWGEGELQSPLIGLFNLSNLLAVISGLCAQGVGLAQVLEQVPQLVAAPGRMQPVVVDAQEQEIHVVVDYAHTPDALENTLKAITEHKTGRIWTVFGCGGDRDKSKRPLMGRIAEKLSDYVIVTNDNPRSEEPASIAADIVRGLNNPNGCLVIADRAQAIDFAVQQAKAGDLVLIAGKGHEDYQIFAGQTLPFSDSQQARLALQRRIAKRDLQREGAQS